MEDNATLANGLAAVLRGSGYAVDIVGDGASAIAVLAIRKSETYAISSGSCLTEPSSSSPSSAPEREKAMRRELLRLALGDEPVHRMPIWAWRRFSHVARSSHAQ